MTKVDLGDSTELSQPAQEEASKADIVERTTLLHQANGANSNGISTPHGTAINGIKGANAVNDAGTVRAAKDAISHGEGQVAVPASS